MFYGNYGYDDGEVLSSDDEGDSEDDDHDNGGGGGGGYGGGGIVVVGMEMGRNESSEIVNDYVENELLILHIQCFDVYLFLCIVIGSWFLRIV